MRRHRKSKQRRLTLKGLKQHRINKMRFAKRLEEIAQAACGVAVGMDMLRQVAKNIHPVTFPSGGIVVPPSYPTNVGMDHMPTGELVNPLSGEKLAKLRNIVIEPLNLQKK